MTTHDRQEPLDTNERELARVVRALPGGEPPAALDALILKASQDALASSSPASVRRSKRWLAGGAIWGIGSAAAAVLAIGVGWQVLNPTTATQLPMPAAQSAPAAASDESDGTTVEFRDEPPRQYDNSPPPPAMPAPAPRAPMRERQAPMQAAPTPIAPAAPPAPPPPPAAMATAPAVSVQGAGAINAIDATSAESTSTLSAEQLARMNDAKAAREQESAQRASSKSESRSRADAVGALSEDTAAAKPQAYARDVAKTDTDFRGRPVSWLAHIRELRDNGDDVQARKSLDDFRKRYPDFPVPSDLTRLLGQ